MTLTRKDIEYQKERYRLLAETAPQGTVVNESYYKFVTLCDLALRGLVLQEPSEEMVKQVAFAIRKNKFERTGRLDTFDVSYVQTPEELMEAKAAIAAMGRK